MSNHLLFLRWHHLLSLLGAGSAGWEKDETRGLPFYAQSLISWSVSAPPIVLRYANAINLHTFCSVYS